MEILDAWRENDLEQLRRELTTAAGMGCPAVGDPDECERVELLGGIAEEMREMVASGHMDGAHVYFSLLNHLAEPAVTAQ